jgi:signal transduction histidine kinase
MGGVTVEGHPAALLARQARCRIFEKLADAVRLREEAADLATVLYSGKWRISQSTFHLYRDILQQWGAPPVPMMALARTEAAILLWRAWRSGDLASRGRRILNTPEVPVAALWTASPDGPVAWLAAPAELEAVLSPLWKAQPMTVSLYDTAGHSVLGALRSSGVTLHPAETRLPFLLSVDAPGDDGDPHRRTLLITGLAATFLLMTAAAFGLYRVTGREMELARQQSDFVSAVSHEFRTPLTSLRHLTELLASGSVPSEPRKQQYYELLSRETGRLHGMVESLLSFGRLEAGAYAWQLETVEPGSLMVPIVEQFRQQQGTAREVVCEMEDGLPPIRADREALSRAIWNLLENAGKYSQPDTLIRVFARRNAGTVALGVEDHGDGIALAEQGRIFQKFVRGTGAKRAGIRGVGIGLALVKRIVEAHGGSVRLESEPGRGSTFILELPCLES